MAYALDVPNGYAGENGINFREEVIFSVGKPDYQNKLLSRLGGGQRAAFILRSSIMNYAHGDRMFSSISEVDTAALIQISIRPGLPSPLPPDR